MDRTALSCIALFLVLAGAAFALPQGFFDEQVFSGIQEPVAVRFAPDDSAFVITKSGQILHYDSVSDVTSTLVADIQANVTTTLDRGLIGLAIHPDYPSQPYVYVAYATTTINPGGRVAKIKVNPSTLQAVSIETLLEGYCQFSNQHTIDDLAFGPDKMLYVSAGEGAEVNRDYGNYYDESACPNPLNEGGSMRSQDLRTRADSLELSGTIIRIDPMTGAAAPGNPLSTDADVNAQRIIAYGLRNPYRMAIDSDSGHLFVIDNGWYLWEEINALPLVPSAPVNFGWPCYEGANAHPDWAPLNIPICVALQPSEVSAPVVSIPHIDLVGASTGIAIYKSDVFPSSYKDGVFYADYTLATQTPPMSTIRFYPRVGPTSLGAPQDFSDPVFAVDVQEGPDGFLYYADVVYGRINRISYATPQAHIVANQTTGSAPLAVSFDGSSSSNPRSGALQYAWDLDGDGAFDDGASAQAQFTFTQSGAFTVRLRVTDSAGLQSTDALLITVGNGAPVPTILSQINGTTYRVGQTIVVQGAAIDPDTGALPPSQLRWNLNLEHCRPGSPCHTHGSTSVGDTLTFVTEDHELPSYYTIILTAFEAGSNWWDSAWTKRQLLTVDTTGVVGSADEVTALLLIDNSANQYGPLSANGADIRFIDEDDTTQLAYEIESWNPTGISRVWVHLHQLSSTSTTVWLYYDNPAATDAQSAAQLWGDEYSFVYHFNSANLLSDASTNGQPLAPVGNGFSSMQGQLGDAVLFDGVTQDTYFDTGYTAALNETAWTFSAWVKTTPTSGCDETNHIMTKGWDHRMYFASSCKLGVTTQRTADDPQNANFPSLPHPQDVILFDLGATEDGGWHHVIHTYDPATSTVHVYVDGQLAGENTTQTSVLGTATPITIGGFSFNPDFTLHGAVDEVRLSLEMRDAAWAYADYRASSGTLFSYGSVEQYTANTGLSASTSISILPQVATVTLESNIPAQMTFQQTQDTTPFTGQVTADGHAFVSAPLYVTQNGTQYRFASWSNGGNASQTILVSGDVTLQATYVLDAPSVTVSANVAGLSAIVNGSTVVLPYTYYGSNNTSVIIEAVPSQVVSGSTYVFTGWSDNGETAHSVPVVDGGTTVSAFYSLVAPVSLRGGGGGGGGGGRRVVSTSNSTNSTRLSTNSTNGTGPSLTASSASNACTTLWTCTDWSECADGLQTRTCSDANECGTTLGRPALSRACAQTNSDLLGQAVSDRAAAGLTGSEAAGVTGLVGADVGLQPPKNLLWLAVSLIFAGAAVALFVLGRRR